MTDASGVRQVRLHYRFFDGSSPGSWDSVTMVYDSGYWYGVIPASTICSGSGYYFDYKIEAEDTYGNVSSSSLRQIPVRTCIC